MDRNKIIGERVRFYRNSKDFSMADLCGFLDDQITLQQLARYETNKSRWPADLLCEVAVALEVDIILLLGMDGAIPAPTPDILEAERYKNALLQLPAKSRTMVFNMIDGLACA